MLTIQPIKSPIGRCLIIYIVLFSSVITLLITAIQLYRDYNTDIELIHSEFKKIENVHLNSLTSALWASNQKLLQTSIDGILKIRDMQYVEIRDEQKIWVKAGKIKGKNNIQRIYSMNYFYRNSDINIGSLIVNVSLDGVYQRLLNKVWVILISNAIKTSLVAIFIYFLFYNLVSRHLSTISEFSKNHDPLSNNTILKLDRNNKTQDELDVVVDSINNMHARLHEQISEIHQQKQYLSQTLNSIGDAVITTDGKGNITHLNPVAEKLTGWKNNEAQKQPLENIFPIVNASTREPITNPVEKVLTTGETVYLSNHTTLIAKDGKEFQIADSAAPIRDGKNILGMVLVFNDVTEQYVMREKLRSKELEQREILESMINAVITIDETGVIYTFNHSAEILFGYSENEILGKNINRLMPEPYSSSHNLHIQNYLKTGIANIIGHKGKEVTGFRKNNEVFSMRIHVAELPPAADGKRRFIGSCTDLTQIKEHEEKLRRSQKMDALGKLTGGIAHDYNNMLSVVLGYSEILKEGLGEQPKLLGYIDKVIHASERGAKLTKKLLGFSKNKSSDIEKLNINVVLKNDQQMLEKTLTPSIKLTLELEENLWPVCLDESELEDAVLNMSINAMHAMKNNGELTIETRNKKINPVDAEHLNIRQGYYVLLCIADTGCGIDEKSKEKIFDPFYTTKGEKGTGLGLSQVYGFVHRCKGTIKVDSQLQQGTQFTLYLPRYQGKDIIEQQTETRHNKALTGNETILVVDDEPALLELACEILIHKNYQVFRAERAKQALEIMQTEHIDLLISDIIMPDMDGYELASIVQKKYPDIKIQLISGFSDEQHTNKIDSNLTQNLLQKPYIAQTLLNRIRVLLQ